MSQEDPVGRVEHSDDDGRIRARKMLAPAHRADRGETAVSAPQLPAAHRAEARIANPIEHRQSGADYLILEISQSRIPDRDAVEFLDSLREPGHAVDASEVGDVIGQFPDGWDSERIQHELRVEIELQQQRRVIGPGTPDGLRVTDFGLPVQQRQAIPGRQIQTIETHASRLACVARSATRVPIARSSSNGGASTRSVSTW